VPKQDGLVRQECGVGIVDIDVSGSSFAFVAPPTKIQPLPVQQLQAIINALEISPDLIKHTALLDNGPVWQVLHLETAAQVLALDSSRVKWPAFKSIGLIGAHPPGSECDFEVRMLAPSSGMSEDPITGSLNAALAHWLYAEGRLTTAITVAQGSMINRHGRVSIRPDADTDKILIGGDTHIVIDGYVTL
jgi:PhzF family phenazine biosynthesis protein